MAGRQQFGLMGRLPSGRWQARYHDPATHKVVWSSETFATKADAGLWLWSVQTELARRGRLDAASGPDVTVAAWAEQWLEQNPNKRRSAQARDIHTVKTWLVPALGEMSVADVTPLDLRRVVETMGDLAPASVSSNLSTVRAVFASAVDSGLIVASPCLGVTMPAKATPERVNLTPEDLHRLAAEVPARFRALILLGGYLGLRWGECAGLRISDLDLDRGTLSVTRQISEVAGILVVEPPTTRSGVRTLVLPPFLVEELRAHLATHRARAGGDALLFVGRSGGTLRRTFAVRTFRPAAKRAGLPDSLTFQGLRHAAPEPDRRRQRSP